MPARRAVLTKLGVEVVLDPTARDVVSAIKDLTRGRGAAASVDAAGVPAAFQAALAGTAVDGNVVVVGDSYAAAHYLILCKSSCRSEDHGVALSCNAFRA